MNYNSFVSKLTSIAPTPNDFLKHGVCNEYALAASENFIAKSKQLVNGTPLDNPGLIDLILNFECNKIQIGLVSFLRNVEETQGYYFVGNVEADILAISKISFEIVVLDHEDKEWVIWPCAQNSSKFFDAILEFATYLSIKIKNSSTLDADLESQYISICTQKAGGEKYKAFYEMLIAG